MIVIVCPVCSSDNVVPNPDLPDYKDEFKCDNCGCKFSKNEANCEER